MYFLSIRCLPQQFNKQAATNNFIYLVLLIWFLNIIWYYDYLTCDIHLQYGPLFECITSSLCVVSKL